MHTDPIADVLTRIRNASRVGKQEFTCPASGLKQQLLETLKSQGYIENVTTQSSAAGHPELRVQLDANRGELHLKRVSKPGRRVYVKHGDVPRVLNGLGIAVLSTPKGIMVDSQARKERIGGEVICEVW